MVTVSSVAGEPKDFYDPGAANLIVNKLQKVVQVEGPIRLELAVKRVASFWGMGRVRQRAVDHVSNLLSRTSVRREISPAGVFLWPKNVKSQEYVGFRVPGTTPGSSREAVDLPLEEVANAALNVLQQQVGLSMDDLVRETGRVFGFSRLGSNVDKRMRMGIETLGGRDTVQFEGGSVSLTRRQRYQE